MSAGYGLSKSRYRGVHCGEGRGATPVTPTTPS